MAGAFVISLDFELMWGVRDRRSAVGYGDAILGGRTAMPQILEAFRAAGIRATWATVGLLFARNRTEMLDFAPALRPAYANAGLSPYPAIESQIGEDEAADPLHYGRSLLDMIAGVEGQEIATHTYSHYYCLEPGETVDAFEADLAAATAIAAHSGMTLRSIVFPRNQLTDVHLAACDRARLTAYRGNPSHFAYRARGAEELGPLVRAYRLLDSVAPLSGSLSHRLAPANEGPRNIAASRFLRIFPAARRRLQDAHVRRVMAEMEQAARSGALYHLWWHPHNFGRDTEHAMAALQRLLHHYRALSDRYGMTSATMSDLASRGFTATA